MAKSSLPTWLPLDRWRSILGVHPLHFHQLYSTTLAKISSTCGDVWFQYAWQDAHRVGRDDVIQAIHDAEQMVADYVGYHLLPDWVTDERQKCTHPARRELFVGSPVNIRGLMKSATAGRGYVISGGIKAKSLIDADVAVTGVALSDEDGDGYDETVTISVATTVTDPDEVRVFYAGQDGGDEWEIRPIQVSISGGAATIVFMRWLIVDHDLQEGMGAAALDGELDASYVGTVDVYRVYNDPQTQAQMLWERDPEGACGCGESSCNVCTFAAQNGCLGVRDSRLAFLTYRPATWDAAAGAFDAADLAVCREPDRVRLWYYSGWQEPYPRNTMKKTHLDPFWERVITRLSIGLLDRDVCSCNNAERFVEYWRTDMSRAEGNVRFQGVTDAQLECPFGQPTRGALYAWKQCNQQGRRVAA